VLAEREVEVAVVEAGLGGRYDATAVVESTVTALTNVGLEHTRWLGPTVHDIATEKLAVLRSGTTLALGADLHPEALAVARAVTGENRARIAQVSPEDFAARPTASADTAADRASTATPGVSPVPTFQRRNFALARVAAEAYLAAVGISLREDAVRAAALATDVPGRLQVVADDPLTVLDGAHNPDAARALVESLGGWLGDARLGHSGHSIAPNRLAHSIGDSHAPHRLAHSIGDSPAPHRLAHSIGDSPAPHRLALVMGVLEDKDAASMLAALLPLCARAWFTAPPSNRALSPAALLSLARQQGFEQAVCEPQPRLALELAQEWARAQPPNTAVLATGSIYLVGDLLAYLRERHAGGGDAAACDAATSDAATSDAATSDAAEGQA
jgi:dihydrofolate synthase/folylpolyglutamate synthase